MPEVEYSSLNQKPRPSSNVFAVIGLLMTFLGLVTALVFITFRIKDTFRVDEIPEKRLSSKDWLFDINDTVSRYVKDDHLIKRPIILLPEPKNTSIEHILVCYYVFPSFETDLWPESINSKMCTHINLAFAQIDPNNHTLEVRQSDLDVIPRIQQLKLQNKNLKMLISLGGAGSKGFSEMVQTHITRKIFIRSLMFFIQFHDLDGVDIDWEFPVVDGNVKEKVKFVQLLNEIKREFERHKRVYILSAAVAAVATYIEMSYYVSHIADAVDFINLMSYDYHFYTPYYPVTGLNAPLYTVRNDSGLDFLNVNYSVFNWIDLGMPREKIVLGLPAYGRTYTLINPDNHDLLAPVSGIGSVGQNGYASISDLCEFLSRTYTVQVYESFSKVPYAYNVYDWISFDDINSFQTKGEYIQNNYLKGAMIWCLNTDDFHGKCFNSTFPLVSKISSILLSNKTIE